MWQPHSVAATSLYPTLANREMESIMRRFIAPTVVALTAFALVIGTQGFGLLTTDSDTKSTPIAAGDFAAQVSRSSGISLQQSVDSLETRVADVPGDYVSWATLSLAYVQYARVTVDPSFYPKAEDAIAQSFAHNSDDNFLAYAGGAALAAGRHDFVLALELAAKGLEINPYSALLYGILSDAQVQLGQYDEGFDSVQKMLDLSPDTSSLSRASYVWELRGDIAQARVLMQRALDDAPTAEDQTFALHHLGQLALEAGDPATALEYQLAALALSPDDAVSQFGRALAEAALGQTDAALARLAELVDRIPDPGYLLANARLLESVGRSDDADIQYAAIEAQAKVASKYGELPETNGIFFHIETGNIDQAIIEAEAGLKVHAFIRTYDAYAWALHAAGRYDEALVQIETALALGTRNASFYYHSGMIKLALGDEAGARADLTTALEINPNFDPLDAPIATQTLETLA